MAGMTDGNYVVMNQGSNPLVNFNFMLRVEALFDLPCKSVRAFSRELEYDLIQEGGLNDYVHMRRKPISKPFTLEIERYVGVDHMDPLPLGADLVLPVMLFVSRSHSQFIPGVVARTYVFTGCTVMKKTYGDLVADQSGLLIETTTIGYREMVCMDIPWSEVGNDIFASTPTSSTNAGSLDKTAEDLKAMGRMQHKNAFQAKMESETEYMPAELDALITRLDMTVNALAGAVGPGGYLRTSMEAAQRAVDGDKEKISPREAATQAAAAAEEKKKEEFAARTEWVEKDRAYQILRQDEERLRRLFEQADGRVKELERQLENDRAELAELKEQTEEGGGSLQAAEAALDSAETEYQSVQAELLTAQQALEEALNRTEELPEERELEALREEIAAAETLRLEAKAAVDAAAGQVQRIKRAAELESGISAGEEALQSAKRERAERNDQLTAAEVEAKGPKEEADAAKKKHEAAEKAWREASAKAESALTAAETAEEELRVASAGFNNAYRLVAPLQNHLTNLRNRKEKTKASQTDCAAQYELCRAANDTLQGMPDEPLGAVSAAYEQVRKYAKQTSFHERQVRDTVQYMASAEEKLKDAENLMPRAETAGG